MPDTSPDDPTVRTLSTERTTSTGHRLYHYEGMCHALHGHNLGWSVSATIDLDESDQTNMEVDLKDISKHIDTYDHTLVLNESDPLVTALPDAGHPPRYIRTTDGDPTCERLAGDLAEQLITELPLSSVTVKLAETTTYTVTAKRTAEGGSNE